jgi:hypothetical protein
LFSKVRLLVPNPPPHPGGPEATFIWLLSFNLSRRDDTARSVCLHEQSTFGGQDMQTPEEILVKVIIPNESN